MRDSLKMLHATKGGKFELVRDKEDTKNCVVQRKMNFLLFVAFRNFPMFSLKLSLKMLHATKRGEFKLVRDKEAPKSALCNEIELHDLHFAIFRYFSSRSRSKCHMQRKSRCLSWFQLMVPLGAICNESKLPDFVALRNIPRFCLEMTPFPTEVQGR